MWTDFIFDEFYSKFVLEIKIHTDSTLTKAEISLKINFDIVTSDFFNSLLHFSFFYMVEIMFFLSENTSEVEIQILDIT